MLEELLINSDKKLWGCEIRFIEGMSNFDTCLCVCKFYGLI